MIIDFSDCDISALLPPLTITTPPPEMPPSRPAMVLPSEGDAGELSTGDGGCEPLRPNFDAIPAELRERPQWVLWRYESRDGRQAKVPYSPRGGRAKANDPRTWGSFEEAVKAYTSRPNHWAGIGYELSADDPYCGIDLDSILDPKTGEWLSWPPSFIARCSAKGSVPTPQQMVAALASYCEISPSKTGVKLILRGKVPQGDHRRDADKSDTRNGKTPGFELYDSGRYFTITGRAVEASPPTIAEANGALSHLHWLVFGDQKKETAKPKPSSNGKSGRRKKQSSATEILDDAKIIELASKAKNGTEFSKLWAGDITGYGSRSDADLALANHLAFYCGPDSHARIESLMRQSGLVREKWDRRESPPGYLDRTIAKALEGRTEFYRPKDPKRKPVILGTDELRVNDQVVEHLGSDETIFRTPDMGLSDVERFRGADAQLQAEVRTRKFGAPSVQFIAQGGDGFRAVARGLGCQLHI